MALDCVHLRVRLAVSQGRWGAGAANLLRAAIKVALLTHQGEVAMALLEPMRHAQAKGQAVKHSIAQAQASVVQPASNVDCAGLMVVVTPNPSDDPRVQQLDLKLLGDAYLWAGRVLMGLQTTLSNGFGTVTGHNSETLIAVIQSVDVWQVGSPTPSGGQWCRLALGAALLMPQTLAAYAAPGNQIAMSQAVSGGGMAAALDLPVDLSGTLELRSTSPWIWRKAGRMMAEPPQLSDVLALCQARLARALRVWGQPAATRSAVPLALFDDPLAIQSQRLHANWQHLRTQLAANTRTRGAARKPSVHEGCQGRLLFDVCLTVAVLDCLYWGVFLHVGQQTAVGKGGFELRLKA